MSAKGLNRAAIIGRLGQDVDMRYAQSGTAVANLSVATNHNVKQDGEWVEKVEWHRVVAFGKIAEVCGQYLSRGSQVYVSGRLQTRSWDDKDGVKRWATEIIVQEVIFLDSKGQGQRQDRPPAPPQDEGDDMTGTANDGGTDPTDNAYEQRDHGGYSDDVPF